jgi:hypothetical protein
MSEHPETIPVTVDKSHLITIGEKLYSQSTELVRELVNNAYDADATEVHVTITEEEIVVRDNGSGMDLEGLKQYFNIGSQEKRLHPRSARLRRERIGQFGIGKFATLSACGSFTVTTQCGAFAATVTFDKEAWEQAGDRWDLPLAIHPPDPDRGDSTTVTLTKLTKRFDVADVEKRIIESVPLKVQDFRVYLNGLPVRPRTLSGQRVPFLEGTPYGPVHGEIIILPSSKTTVTEPLGIECKVKQVTVRRELFGMETWGREMARVRGEVHADFLPITSDRSGFITDSAEYQAFIETMLRVMAEVKRYLGRVSDERETRGARKALREALHRIQSALGLNPDFAPPGILPLAGETPGLGGAGLQAGEKKPKAGTVGAGVTPKAPRRKKAPAPRAAQLTPNAVIQRLKMGHTGITCCLDHFGADGPECFTEGTIIYINRDHPLYEREIKKRETHTMHIARLLTQEIALMRDPLNPRQAFERQSKLLRDAFRD